MVLLTNNKTQALLGRKSSGQKAPPPPLIPLPEFYLFQGSEERRGGLLRSKKKWQCLEMEGWREGLLEQVQPQLGATNLAPTLTSPSKPLSFPLLPPFRNASLPQWAKKGNQKNKSSFYSHFNIFFQNECIGFNASQNKWNPHIF